MRDAATPAAGPAASPATRGRGDGHLRRGRDRDHRPVCPLDAAIRDASADRELAKVPERDKSLRYQPHAAVMQQVAGKTGLSQQIPVARATQIAATLMSGETCGQLAVGHGWTVSGRTDGTSGQGSSRAPVTRLLAWPVSAWHPRRCLTLA